MRPRRTAIARVQICRVVTPDRVLDVSDLLSLDSRGSRISFSLSEAGAGDTSASGPVRHAAHASDVKLVCRDILHRKFTEWTDEQGGDGAPEDEHAVSALTIQRDAEDSRPFLIKIDNGIGEATARGGVKLLRATASLTLRISEWDARRLTQTVLDYIHDWETINFRQRQEAQTLMMGGPEAFS